MFNYLFTNGSKYLLILELYVVASYKKGSECNRISQRSTVTVVNCINSII